MGINAYPHPRVSEDQIIKAVENIIGSFIVETIYQRSRSRI